MSNQPKSRDRYLKLLDAYRQLGPNHNEVAKLIGCDLRTARSVYTQGWPRFQDWAEPLRDVIAREQTQARALRAQATESAELQAETDSIAQRAAESQLLGLARSAALGLLHQCSGLVSISGDLAADLQNAIARHRENFDVESTDTKELLRLLTKVGDVVKSSIESAREIAELERVVLGVPNGPSVNIAQAFVFTPEQHAHNLSIIKRRMLPEQSASENDIETDCEEVAQ